MEQPSEHPSKPLWRRLMPVAVLLALFGAFFASGLNQYISFEALREHRMFLTDFVAANALTAILLYILVYTLVVAASLPGATIFTVTGGFLFGSILGSLYTVVAATIGATAIFLAARYAFGDTLRAKGGKTLERILKGFQEDAFSYLLVLRLVPLFPFFLVNIAPAFADVKLRTYLITTFLGIIPGSFVYAQVGTGLGSIFDAGEEFTLGTVLTPEIIGALAGLAVLSMVPVVYKRIKGRKPA
jgi:uncharacterized membrane protein YdjX (TVP38/TMEM64 family)